MKIGIIINFKKIQTYENNKFRDEALKCGVNLVFLDRMKLDFIISDKLKLYYDGKLLEDIDYFFPRTGSATSLNDKAFFNAIRLSGKSIINSGDVIFELMDKQAVLTKLSQNNISVLKTMVVNELNLSIVDKEFSFPLILKQNTGSLGYGIYKINNCSELYNMIDVAFFSKNNSDFLIQEFIDSDIACDYRVIVFMGNVIGSMKRIAKEGDFITNFSNNGSVTSFELDEFLIDKSIKIANILNCEMCGIDYLKKDNDYLVCEVNSSPGFHGMDMANPKINIANKMIKSIKKDLNNY